MTTPPRAATSRAAPAPGSLSDSTNLALGKYVRVGSGRDRDARACASDDVAECFIAGRGEVLFVGLLVFLPRLGVPDLQVVDRADHHTLLGKIGVAAMVGGQGDPTLGVRVLFVGAGGEVAQERPGPGVA